MNGHLRWCEWCCHLRYPLCCSCSLCIECCRCCPSPLPSYCPPEPLPPLPCLGQAPPPARRVIREHVIVPIPYPVCPRGDSCLSPCWTDPCNSCRPPSAPFASCFGPKKGQRSSGPGCSGDPCYRSKPRNSNGKIHPSPWPNPKKRLHKGGVGLMPGYKGHIPGFRFHAAGRTFGAATQDTCCIMSQWSQCCPQLPFRIFEQ